MENKKKKPLQERIDECIKTIVASKDQQLKKSKINELISLQKQRDVVPVELIVPTSEVTAEIDLGPCKIQRTIRGYLFTCRGGMQTFVELRMARLCAVFDTLFYLHDKEDKKDEDNDIYKAFCDAICYCYQAPVFACLSEDMLFSVATDILKRFNEYGEEHYTNAEEQPETEQDIRDNIAADKMAEAMETLVNTPIPEDI